MATLFKLVAAGLIASVTASSGKMPYNPECGYAPLCGTEATYVMPPMIGQPATFELDECCTLADTKPVQPDNCDIVNPDGMAFRYVSTKAAVCNETFNSCSDECSENILTITPAFKFDERPDCCDSCTCYGDPECIAFDGTEQMWLLCDGREVPTNEFGHKRCLITREGCESQLDHEGNTCHFNNNAQDNGKNWNLRKKGSPCGPSKESGPSEILMYKADDYACWLQQGERGIITTVSLTTDCGRYNLTAENCLEKGENAWTIESSDPDLPDYFSRTEVIEGNDVLWSVIDATSGIATQIRCYGNMIDGDDTVYVPRLNVEDLAEPVPSRQRTGRGGFCVTGRFDTGDATTEKTEDIEENGLCDAGNDGQETLANYRAICQNPGLPNSGIESCRQSFCDAYWIMGTYSSAEECDEAIELDQANGFCNTVRTTMADIQECLFTWETDGPVFTVNKYLMPIENPDNCVTSVDELPVSLETCQKGFTLQYMNNNGEWVDSISFPESRPLCNPPGEISVTECDYPELFSNKIRIYQSTNQVECQPVNRCTPTDGSVTIITFDAPTPEPTLSPTPFPSCPEVPVRARYFNLMFCDSEVVENNLNNEGPVAGNTEAIEYEDAGYYDNKKLELLITNSYNDYKAGDSSQNGIYDENCHYGVVNVDCGTTTTIEFTMYNNDDLYQIEAMDLSFFDICTEDGSKQKITICDASELYPADTDDSTLDFKDENGCIVIESTENCGDVGLPPAPDKYDEEQYNRIVQAYFVDAAIVSVTLEATGNCDEGRNFYYAGYSIECAAPSGNPTPRPITQPTPYPGTPHTWPPHSMHSDDS